MTTIQVLPYVGPDKSVTANTRIKSLEEHFLAFLASNNSQGYLDEEFDGTDDVTRMILDMSKREYISYAEYRYVQLKIKEAAPSLHYEQVTNIVARALGYAMEDHMLTNSSMVSQQAAAHGIHENLIYSARFQLSVYRRRTVKRAEEEGARGTAGLFRAAILRNSRVTQEEIDLLIPELQVVYKKFMLMPTVTTQAIKDDLNVIFLDENRRRNKSVKEGRATVLDAMYLVLGYAASAAAVQYEKKHGVILNRRHAEHMAVWKTA